MTGVPHIAQLLYRATQMFHVSSLAARSATAATEQCEITQVAGYNVDLTRGRAGRQTRGGVYGC